MKLKFYLSSLTLILFVLLGGGSVEGNDLGGVIFAILLAILVTVTGIAITDFVKTRNKNKRLKMIEEDEADSTDFDRSVFIGNDRCKIYFDSQKRQVMIMRVTTEEITKKYVDDFEFPGKELSVWSDNGFSIYDPINRKLLSVSYNDTNLYCQVTSIADEDKNKDVTINNTIKPKIVTLNPSLDILYHILIDERRGVIARFVPGGVGKVLNYVNAEDLPKKKGQDSTVNTKEVGSYMFIMDDFYNVLVLIGKDTYEVFNYTDIIEVSYEENGNQLYTKSAGRTVGGAIVGGMLMGGAGAVVGGLSGATAQNKEVKSIDVKILLRSIERSSYVLHFNAANRVLKTKVSTDKSLYEVYTKCANLAKDLFSVIIDKAQQQNDLNTQQVTSPSISPSLSVADELSKLAKLKADGILTEEEFQTQKAKLLG